MNPLSEKLRNLDALWTALGMPPTGLWAPGLPVEAVHQALDGIVQHIPDEIIDWYTWHNGWDTGPLIKPTMAPCFFDPYPLRDALEMRLEKMAQAQRLEASSGKSADFWWPTTWLPFATDDGGGLLVINLADFQEIPANAILAPNWEDFGYFRESVASSMTDMVDVWLEVLPYGFWSWGVNEAQWESAYHPSNSTIPQHLKRRAIVE